MPVLHAAEGVSSYRRTYNLPVLSKLLDRLVAGQKMQYLSTNHLQPPLQSGFRTGHSTVSAISRYLTSLSDILHTVVRGDITTLILHLSEAFNTVNHDILFQRLRLSFDSDAITHRWFMTYLTGQSSSDLVMFRSQKPVAYCDLDIRKCNI